MKNDWLNKLSPEWLVRFLQSGLVSQDQLSNKQVSAAFAWILEEYGEEYVIEQIGKNMSDEDWFELIKAMRESGMELPPELRKLLH